jgi:S1-C subfamily serine protease
VISGQRIVTNAHVVADQTFVKVRKHGSPQKFKAKVLAVGHECDLALLTVEDEEFWEGMQPLDLGDIPFLQEAVAVVGYPQGCYVITLLSSANYLMVYPISCFSSFIEKLSFPGII